VTAYLVSWFETVEETVMTFVWVARLHQGDLDGEAAGHRRLQVRGVCAEVLDFAAALNVGRSG